MVSIIGATALEVIFDVIKNDPETTGKTYMGEAPDTLGLLREVTAGDAAPELTMGTIVAVERSIIDVGIRAEPGDYTTPRNEALRIRYLVGAINDYTSRGIKVHAALPLGNILPQGRDANGRWQFSVRFEVWAAPSYVDE